MLVSGNARGLLPAQNNGPWVRSVGDMSHWFTHCIPIPLHYQQFAIWWPMGQIQSTRHILFSPLNLKKKNETFCQHLKVMRFYIYIWTFDFSRTTGRPVHMWKHRTVPVVSLLQFTCFILLGTWVSNPCYKASLNLEVAVLQGNKLMPLIKLCTFIQLLAKQIEDKTPKLLEFILV